MNSPTLYHYWRSSSSWRVRWALEIKKIKSKMIAVNLLDGASESKEHLSRHPMGYVPVLEVKGGFIIQSVAIIEYLEEMFPEPKLFPIGALEKSFVRGLVEIINADTQPIQNLSVMDKYSDDPGKRLEWNQHFISRGLEAFAERIQTSSGKYSFGDQITAADLFLIPQCYNALRNELKLENFGVIKKIYEDALQTAACKASHPDSFKPPG